MTVNARLRDLYPESEEMFDIVLVTNNHAQVGVRLINSINYYGMRKYSREKYSASQRGIEGQCHFITFHPIQSII